MPKTWLASIIFRRTINTLLNLVTPSLQNKAIVHKTVKIPTYI